MHKLFLILNGVCFGFNLRGAIQNAVEGETAWALALLAIGLSNLAVAIVLANQAYGGRHA